MNEEEIKRMEELCRLIQIEKDPQKFGKLVAQLNDLLEDNSQRLERDDNDPTEKS